MSFLDSLENNHVDVRRCISSDESDDVVWLKTDCNTLFQTNSWDLWLSFAPNHDQEKDARTFIQIIQHFGIYIPGIIGWSPVYILKDGYRRKQISVGFDVDIRSSYAAIRMIISILSFFSRRKHIALSRVVWFSYTKSWHVFKTMYDLDYRYKFGNKTFFEQEDGVRKFCEIICKREISSEEWKKTTERMVNFHLRLKLRLRRTSDDCPDHTG